MKQKAKKKTIPHTGDKWWLLKRKPRRDKIPDAVKKDVEEFYLSPGISRPVPDKKAVVKMKSGECKQRHNMLMTQ